MDYAVLVVSSTVVSRTAMENLSQTVRASLSEVKGEDGELRLSSGFQFTRTRCTSWSTASRRPCWPGSCPAFHRYSRALPERRHPQCGHRPGGQLCAGLLGALWLGERRVGPGRHRGGGGGPDQPQRGGVGCRGPAPPAGAGRGGWVPHRQKGFRPLDQMAATASAIMPSISSRTSSGVFVRTP